MGGALRARERGGRVLVTTGVIPWKARTGRRRLTRATIQRS